VSVSGVPIFAQIRVSQRCSQGLPLRTNPLRSPRRLRPLGVGYGRAMAPAGIAVTVEKDVRAPLEATFRAIVPIELARIFRGLGPLPAVVGTREQTGAWDHVGASRIVELSDGSQAHEQLMAYKPPRHFAYRLDGFTGPLRGLVSHADGAWWFSDAGDGATHVRWMYVFAPRAARASVVRAVIAPLWSVYERRALSLAASEAERTTGR
jgi:Polyketide cyclase / dehydrase and lipid transport